MKVLATASPSDTERRVWIAVDDRWLAYLRFGQRGGEFVLAELRVLPRAANVGDEAGEVGRQPAWSGAADRVPAGGLPLRILRDLRLSDLEVMDGWQREAEWIAPELPPDIEKLIQSGERWPRDLTPLVLAALADAYVQLLDLGVTDPSTRLAEMTGRSKEWVTQALYRARHRYDLLTPSPAWGKPGGELTEEGVRQVGVAREWRYPSWTARAEKGEGP